MDCYDDNSGIIRCDGSLNDFEYLQKICAAVKRNDPALHEIDTNHFNSRDVCLLLGRAMVGNTHLKRLILSDQDITKRSAKALAQGFAQSKLQEITFEGFLKMRESDAIIQILSDGLRSATTIRTATFKSISYDDIVNKDGIDDVLLLLSGFSNLNELRLQALALNRDTARFVATRIGELKVKYLHLGILRASHERDSSEAEKLVLEQEMWQILQDGLVSAPKVHYLELDEVEIYQPNRWAEIFSHLKDLSISLSCADCVVEPVPYMEYAELLGNVLATSATLQFLTVDQVALKEDDVARLIEGLARNTSLILLNIDDGNLNSANARQLLQVILNHPRMQDVSLNSNSSIGYNGIRLLAQDLLHHPSQLRRISFWRCTPYCSSTEQPADESSSISSQRPLDLGGESDHSSASGSSLNRRNERKAARIRREEKRQAEQALLDFVRANLIVQRLDVETNGFSHRVEHEIRFYTCLNELGRFLLVAQDHHRLPVGVWSHILAKCQTKPEFDNSCTFFFLREQPNLVQRDVVTCRKRQRDA